MLHSITDKYEQTIRGMTIQVKIAAPAGATIDPLRDKIAELFAFAAKDPSQFGLFDDKAQTKTKGE